MLLDIFKPGSVGIRLAACLLALTVRPRLMEAQQGLSRSSRDVSVSDEYWYRHGNTLEMFEGDALYNFGLNHFKKPDVHTIVESADPARASVQKTSPGSTSL